MAQHLRTREVAQRLDVTEETIRDWIASGKLPAVKIGKSWRIRSEDVDRILQEGLSPEPRPCETRERGA
jgi:excisionase family DNA binding protein